MREKAGFGSNLRYKTDFLDFCKDDIHWFNLIFQQLFLGIYAYKKRVNQKRFQIDYFVLTLLIARNVGNFVVMYRTFFTKIEL